MFVSCTTKCLELKIDRHVCEMLNLSLREGVWHPGKAAILIDSQYCMCNIPTHLTAVMQEKQAIIKKAYAYIGCVVKMKTTKTHCPCNPKFKHCLAYYFDLFCHLLIIISFYQNQADFFYLLQTPQGPPRLHPFNARFPHSHHWAPTPLSLGVSEDEVEWWPSNVSPSYDCESIYNVRKTMENPKDSGDGWIHLYTWKKSNKIAQEFPCTIQTSTPHILKTLFLIRAKNTLLGLRVCFLILRSRPSQMAHVIDSLMDTRLLRRWSSYCFARK